MKRKYLSIFMLIFSLFVLASCGGEKENPTSNSGTSPISNTTNPNPSSTTSINPTVPTTTTSTSVPAHTHNILSTWEDDESGHWHACSGCDEKFDFSEHNNKMTITTEASCDTDGVMTYECNVCGHKHTVSINKTAHTVETVNEVIEKVAGESCKYVLKLVGECSKCHHEETLSETYFYQHDYGYSVTTKATCSAIGVITYECKDCHDTYTRNYEDLEAHAWDEGTKEGNVVTYHCSLCEASKNVFDASTQVQATVNTEDLAAVDALELKNATIALDDATLADLGVSNNVAISADTVEVDNLQIELSDELKNKISDKVYDFSMSVDGNEVSQFSGKIKITIPYELSEGEDPNNIVIWYLSDEEPENILATYSDGFVSFETEHFSYYTIVKMSKEEICRIMGHDDVLVETIDPTCLTEGYEIYTCRRCGEAHKEVLEKVNHKFEEKENVAPTKFNEGYIVYECEHCKETKLINFPKLVDEENNAILTIYSNYVNQLKDGGYKIIATSGPDAESNMEMMALINNGKLIAVNSGEYSGISIIDLKTGIVETYSMSDEYISKSSYSNLPQTVIAMLQVLFGNSAFDIKGVFQYFNNEKLNAIAANMFNLFFKVEEVNGKYEVTIDSEKLTALLEELNTMTVSGLVDKLLGEGTFALIQAKLTAYKELTVGEIIEDLKASGDIDIEGLFEFAMSLLEYVKNAVGLQLPVDASMIREMYASIKTQTIEQAMSAIPNMQGMTYDQILQMVEGYKDMPLATLIQGFAHMDISQIPLAAYLSLVDFKLTATKDLAIEKIDLEISSAIINPRAPEGSKYEVHVGLNNDKTSYRIMIEEIQREIEPLELSLSKHAWLDSIIKDCFGNDVKLSYSVDKNGDINVDIDEVSTASLLLKLNYYSNDLRRLLAKYEKLRVKLVFNNSYSGTNINVLKDYGYYHRSVSATAYLYGIDINNEARYLTHTSSYSIGLTGALFDKNNNKYYLIDSISGSSHLYKYESIALADIPANAKIEDRTFEDPDYEEYTKEYYYIKQTCELCSEVRYFKYLVYKDEGRVVSHYENFDARYDAFLFTLNPEYRDIYVNVLYEYDGTKIVTSIEPHFSNTDKINPSYQSADGKVKLELLSSRTEGCYTYNSYKFTIVDRSFVFNTTEANHDFDASQATEEEIPGSCTVIKHIPCTNCDEEHLEYLYRHDFEKNVLLAPTDSQDGIALFECKKCHDYYYDSLSPLKSGELVLEDLTSVYPYDEDFIVIGYKAAGSYIYFDELVNLFEIRMVISFLGPDGNREVVTSIEDLEDYVFIEEPTRFEKVVQVDIGEDETLDMNLRLMKFYIGDLNRTIELLKSMGSEFDFELTIFANNPYSESVIMFVIE